MRGATTTAAAATVAWEVAAMVAGEVAAMVVAEAAAMVAGAGAAAVAENVAARKCDAMRWRDGAGAASLPPPSLSPHSLSDSLKG